MHNETTSLTAVLSEYNIPDADIQPVHGGNINTSFAVTASGSNECILQRVNPIFAGEIHEDIETVTRHIQEKGLLTPRLIRNRQGELFTEHDGEIWRLMTRINGVTIDVVDSTARAEEAAVLLARFHKALVDLDYEFKNRRSGIHDTPGHLRNLTQTLETGRDHARFGRIKPLAEEILERASDLPELATVGDRKVHGDPKINNILFDAQTGKAKCLIDLDTLGIMPLPLELGDALRSWCNPHGEDTEQTEFSLSLFEAALEGYAGEVRDFIRANEWRSILPATYRICLELAARFCADALNESYFNWDPNRFNSRSEHSEIRARGQLQSARSLKSQYDQAEKIIARVFG